MFIIGYFRDLFENIVGLISFVSEPNTELTTLFGHDTSILQLMSVSLGAFLLVVLGLHVFHLLKPIG